MHRLLRYFAAFLLGLLACFCAFGFVASFEAPFPNAFHVIYAVVGVNSTGAGLWLVLRRSSAD